MATPMSGSTVNIAMRPTTPMEALAPSAPMGVIAPYMLSRLLSTRFTTAMPICMTKLAKPSARMRRMVSMSGRISRTCRRIGQLLVKMKYHITHTHEANWPHSVASALPATPQPRIMTNRKLKMVQNTAPITMVTSARVGAPAVRMKLLTPAPMTWKMKPAPRIWMNRREYSQSSAVAPEIASTASINGGICVKTNTMTASTMPSVMVLPRQR